MRFVCLAIPGIIVELDAAGEHALVDYGDGTRRRVNVSLVEVSVGEYVLVHAGFAIQVVDKRDALETLSLFREMLSKGEG